MINSVRGVSHIPPPQADPDLAKARRQLADWESCPSRKTSAGQAKIKQYTAQVSELAARDNKAQMEKATQAATAAHDAMSRASSGSANPSGAPSAPGQDANAAVAALGANIDVYA